MNEQTIKTVLNDKIEDGHVVKRINPEIEGDYIVTQIQDMQEFPRKAIKADDNFTPEEQEGHDELIQMVITGELLEKFTDEDLVFPEVPITFSSNQEYKKYWLYLIQYEIFSKLLSQSSNKKQKIVLGDEEIEKNELIKTAQKEVQGKKKAPGVWACYCRLFDTFSRNAYKKNKGNRVQDFSGLILKMYKTPPITESYDDEEIVPMIDEVHLSPEEMEIISADEKFNLHFSLKQVRN